MNREMLKECIADAKTIRETAIASAKVALEEAFTPQLTAMFAEKLNELEVEEEMEEKSVDEMYGMEEEGLEEDFNLEELLAELSKEDNEDSKMKKEGMKQELDEDLMLEEMSDEEIEELVMQVIDDMIASGKLMPGEGEEEDMEDMGDMEDMENMETEEEVDIDEILAEMEDKEELDEEKESMDEYVDPYVSGGDATIIAAAVLAGVAGLAWSSLDKEKRAEYIAKAKNLPKLALQSIKQMTGLKEEETTEATNDEMEETINELRKELNEVNLLNAKLLYTNKIFKAKNLTESEKIKVLNTFDKAETVKEVKLVFETLTESFRATTAKKNPIKESLGSASKTISTATPKQPIIEVNSAFARMQQLAGLKK
jgi:hypothetical protein